MQSINMYFIALLALVTFASGQDFMLDLDCDKYPGPCNNDCYAMYVAELPHVREPTKYPHCEGDWKR
jgi:hypothetical protein